MPVNEWKLPPITNFKPLQATSFAPKKPPVEVSTMPNSQSTENISKGLSAGHETFKTEGNINAIDVGKAEKAITDKPLDKSSGTQQEVTNLVKNLNTKDFGLY